MTGYVGGEEAGDDRLAVRRDVLEVLTIHARRALVGAALSIGVRQNVLAADLVVEGVEAVAGFCLRFRVWPGPKPTRIREGIEAERQRDMAS